MWKVHKLNMSTLNPHEQHITGVEEAQRAINAAHVEVEGVENGVGIVKLMGRHSGLISLYATLASRDVAAVGFLNLLKSGLKKWTCGYCVSRRAGQEYVGLWLTQKIKLPFIYSMSQDHFTKVPKMAINMKYIEARNFYPTYMIRAIPSNASDNIHCTLLAHSAVHGAMAGFSGFTVGPVSSKHAYIPIARVTENQNKVSLTDRMWARLLAIDEPA
ncbi:hypothetical protein DVH24_024543 [Malus domestica]|uniref:Phosphofructokinase domain-containing protein n=1 Tax=Malus domestica TaxID=3750 RepID=A0A498JG90_MALDO|nr:hypothetical protein DVH24_024543 [Malus domestica]